MIFVENTRPHVFGIGNLIVGEALPANIILRPGVNRLENNIWSAMSEHPIIQKYLESGDLRVETLVTQEADSGSGGLSSLTTRKAQKIIQNTFDPDLLQSWKVGEDRVAIIRYIDNQLKLIRPGAEDDDGELDSEE